jgi:hypothetical protein
MLSFHKGNANKNDTKIPLQPSQNDYHEKKCWGGCGEKEIPIYCLKECELVQSIWKSQRCNITLGYVSNNDTVNEKDIG